MYTPPPFNGGIVSLNTTFNGTNNTAPNQVGVTPGAGTLVVTDQAELLATNLIADNLTLISPSQGGVTVTGTASGTPMLGSGGRLSTGATAGSTHLWRATTGFIEFVPLDGSNLWDKQITLAFSTRRMTRGTNSFFRLQFGRDFTSTTIGDLTQKGIGISVIGSAIFLEVHNGTTRSVSAQIGTITTEFLHWRLRYAAGTATLHLNGVLLGTRTGGPAGTPGTNGWGINVSLGNGADAVDYNLDVNHFLKLIMK